MLPHIGVAILTFIITNVDDLIILTVFFANPRYKRENVIVGQIVGIFLLVAISMAGVYLGTILEEHHLDLLGLLPLIIGVNYERRKTTGLISNKFLLKLILSF